MDCIPDSDMLAARKILRALADPVEASLSSAPIDDEPETGTSHEEVLRQFGL